jgi:outer membrane protein assembly factor BamE (lipoprotein component of BamABCDE complex)
MKKFTKNIKMRNFLSVLLLFVVISCISRVEKKGYMFDISGVEFLETGVTGKDKALQIMGSPTIASYLDDDELWIYYSEEIRHLLFFKPKVLQRRVLTLDFDRSGTLKYMKNYDLSDEKDVEFASKKTEVESAKIGFFKALFGNIGQVRPQ